MLKIGFIQAQGNDSRSYGIPLSFGYLIATLRQNGLPFEYHVTAEPYDLADWAPDLIAISSVTSCFWQVPQFAEVFHERLPETRLVLGGHHIGALPQHLPEAVDVGVIGEGEDTFLDLVRRFVPGVGWSAKALREVRGICYRDTAGTVRVTERRALRSDLDTLPLPVRGRNHYQPDEAVLFTSRGCPFHCTYCATQRYWEKFRRFSAAYVVHELEQIVASMPHVRSVYVLDDLFVADRGRLRELTRMIEQSGLNRRLSFHGFVRSNLVDDELCELLLRMNVRAVRFGAESGSDAVLRRMERGGKCTVATHQNAIDVAHRHGLACGASFMLGFPGETRADLQQTFDFIRRNAGRLAVEGCYLTVPFPGTELWNWAAERGYVDETMDWRRLNLAFDNPDFDWSDFLYLNEETLPRGEFVRAVLDSGILPPDVYQRGARDVAGQHATARMTAVMAELAAGGVRRVALYGAGVHTRRLTEWLSNAPVAVVGLLDDNAGLWGSHLGPFRVHSPEAAASLNVDAVILSSDSSEEALWQRRERFERLGIRVCRLYGAEQRLVGA
ncbi:MAG: radical SAM protein [Planctomycetes bacterium]|nr:radical SAM protein [Planctomycetota bacterium]